MVRCLGVCAAALVLLVVDPCGFAQKQGSETVFIAKDRIRGPIVDSDAVTLAGNTHPLARAEFDRGAVEPETRLERMVLLLQPSAAQQGHLDALTEAQQEPASAAYHQWLTPAEYGNRFGVSPNDLGRITAWLAGHGFTVDEIPAGRRSILFSGTAEQVAETFHTEIHQYRVEGHAHLANVEDPQIPRALASVVAGIVSLHDFRRVSATSSMRAVANPANTQGNAHYLFPADFATIYDLNPLYAVGRNGAGVSIAIVGRSNIDLDDVRSFRAYAGLPVNQPTVLLAGPNPGRVSGDQEEATLDVEWAGGVAPGAAVKLVAAASTSVSDGVDLAAQYIVNHKTAPVMSTSFGNCEAHMGATELAFYNSLWQQAAVEGISAFVASGDSGAAGCNAGGAVRGSGAAVNGLCSSPYSTCVGGTEFRDAGSGQFWSSSNGSGGGSAVGYISEQVWNESGSNGGSGLWASGGGASTVYAQPGWQKDVSGAGSNGMRVVPDVSLTAASHDGYLVCLNGSWYIFSGTSAATPSLAGILSLVVQGSGGAGQGGVNPTLYGLLNASVSPFHATPSGNNSVPGVYGFAASGAAYSLATGLGSVDANLLVATWPSSVAVKAGFTLKPSVAAESLAPSKSGTFSISIAGSGGFTGAVALTAKTPPGVTISFASASVNAGNSTMATVTVAKGAVGGMGKITITGTSGSLVETATVSLTIPAAATLAAETASGKISVARGKTATLLVTTTTGGSFAGTVTLGVSALPKGVSATWNGNSLNGNSFTTSGASATVSSLTLKAAKDTRLQAGMLQITVAGDGLQAQARCAIQIR